MIKLVKQSCIKYSADLLAALEELSPGADDANPRVFVRHGLQGLVFDTSQGSKKCIVSAWGAVSVDVVFFTNGVKGVPYGSTTSDVVATAQKIFDFFVGD